MNSNIILRHFILNQFLIPPLLKVFFLDETLSSIGGTRNIPSNLFISWLWLFLHILLKFGACLYLWNWQSLQHFCKIQTLVMLVQAMFILWKWCSTLVQSQNKSSQSLLQKSLRKGPHRKTRLCYLSRRFWCKISFGVEQSDPIILFWKFDLLHKWHTPQRKSMISKL